MWLQRRKNNNGDVYYAFSYEDPKTGKRIRLKKGTYPVFTNEEDARRWANSQTAYQTAKTTLIQKKLEWKNRYFDFSAHADKFKIWHERRAPNSWVRGVQILEQEVLPWFLDVKHAGNIYDWAHLYPEWKTFLEGRVQAGEIGYSTANKCIHILNALLACLHEHGDLPEAVPPCGVFPNRLLPSKDFTSVISDAEFKVIEAALRAKSVEGTDEESQKTYRMTADMYTVLFHTGMRLNEAFSLPIDALFPGKVEGLLGKALEKHGITHVGYVVLESQLAGKYQVREEDGSFKRKPLKSKPRIHPKYSRTIPITDKACWNVLARLYKEQKTAWEKQTHGKPKTNYLLFDGFVKSTATRRLAEVYEKSPFTPKTWHDCRHSFCTHFAGKVIGDTTTPRMILGHTSAAIERYMHIYEQVALEAKKKDVEIDEIA